MDRLVTILSGSIVIAGATQIMCMRMKDSVLYLTNNPEHYPVFMHYETLTTATTLFDMQLAFKTGRAEGTYREIPEVWLGLLMEIRGLHCSEQTTPNEIRQALIDSMKKPVDYTGWSVRELRRSIIARGIRRSCVDRNRARLVSILEKEDAQPDSTHCFPFERLVPELRRKVYEYTAVSSVPITGSETPAITQLSQQTSEEALRVFASENTFELHGILGWEITGPTTGYHSNTYSIDPRTTAIFRRHPEISKYVRKVLITIHFGFMKADRNEEDDIYNTVTIIATATSSAGIKYWTANFAPLTDYAREDPNLKDYAESTATRAMALSGIAGAHSSSTIKHASEDVVYNTSPATDVRWRELLEMTEWYLQGKPNDYVDCGCDCDCDKPCNCYCACAEPEAGFVPDFEECFDEIMQNAYNIMSAREGRY